jgi:SAM-dependent methyltransferase
MKLLDVDTGGGEFLLSLGHHHENTAVTEGYEPNVALCKKTLGPLGIDVRQAEIAKGLPFPDESFDMVINRHGDMNPREFARVLKPGGYFVTQQVGAENDREFVRLLLDDVPEVPFPEQYLEIATRNLQKEGFTILDGRESYTSMTFTDVGALVWFARIIPWEFPDFSVDRCLPQLLEAQKLLAWEGKIEGKVHRFLVVAQKK